ncbi:MAG: 16S rRNA (cytosine(967)-C(5))-methyltransferase RsmB [Bacillota bacterium]
MSARRKALEALVEITDHGAYANLKLKETLSGVSEQEARWVSAAVYTAIEHLAYIDHVLSGFVHQKPKPIIRGILRLGVCQLLYMNVPDSAVCDESVKLAREVGKGALSGYVNGVLRNICRNKGSLPALPENLTQRLSIESGYPEWIVEEYIGQYGEEFARNLLFAQNLGLTLRAQPPFTPKELGDALCARGVSFSRGTIINEAFKLEKGFDIASDALFLEGKVAVQSESAMLAAKACKVGPGMRVLDACAAPGGKSAYLAALMEDRGHLEAWEVHEHRKELLDKTLGRLHVRCANTRVQDACELREELVGSMDAVLVDAPCSGLGVSGKPDIRYARSPGDIQSLAALQKKILDCCANYVALGGALVYATCTVSKRENQDVVSDFLKRHAEFQLDPFTELLPDGMRYRAKDGMLHLFPHMDHTDGFFIARMVKR